MEWPTFRSVWELISLHEILFLAVTLHVLQTRREPASALLWIFAAWSLPFLGPLLYLFFGIYKVPAKARRKQEADERLRAERRVLEDSRLALTYWRSVRDGLAVEPENPLARDLNRAMSRILEDYPLVGGNTIRLLITGAEAYPHMLESIQGAAHHIHLQSFIIQPDTVGRQFMDALATKARQGVQVRVLYDRFGSSQAVLSGFFRRYRGVPNLQLCGWTQADLLKRQFQINLRNHRKLLIVDGQEAFAGGINLSRDNLPSARHLATRDYHVALTGPIVQELQFSFLRDWHFMTGESPEELLHEAFFPAQTPTGHALIRLVDSGPSAEMDAIEDVFFLSITAARQAVWAVTPYFAPPAEILRALRSAALRGVDVRLVVPRDNNHAYAGLAGRALYDELLSVGVRIFERHPPFLHAKALVVDDAVALVGTANLDVRSLRLNYESDLAVYDSEFIADMKNVIRQEIALSHEIDLAAWRQRPLRQRMLENFCSLLTPIL